MAKEADAITNGLQNSEVLKVIAPDLCQTGLFPGFIVSNTVPALAFPIW
jgi:hypothetical protein